MLSHRIRRAGFGNSVLSLALLIVLTGAATAADLVHDTQTAFTPGTFDLTVLEGTEPAPEIRLDTFDTFSWWFEDDDIAGWTFNGDVAEEDPDGQIHLAATSAGPEAYGFASRGDQALPDQFVAEYLIYMDVLPASGVADPMVDQPTGGCCRLDLQRADTGFRMDVFTDRMVAIYREGTAGIDYPTIDYIDTVTPVGVWITIRLEVDFTTQTAQVYRDDVFLGTLSSDVRNATTTTFRSMAYSRSSASGLVEFHVDRIRLGSGEPEFYVSGSYTSPEITIAATSLGTLSWTEIAASPYPWQPWVKYAGNPIVGPTALLENILFDLDDHLAQPILYDGYYWAVYSNTNSNGLIRSNDPNLMIWEDYGVVQPPFGDEENAFSPNLFLDNGTYYMFYDTRATSDSIQRVAFATATAPTGPWTQGQIILDVGAAGEWDDLRVSEPFVFKEGGTYFLYYMGDHGSSGAAEQIGLATTTEALFPLGPEAGDLWTKQGLVLPHNPDGWESGLTADPSVLKVGDTYFMRYTGSYANAHWQLGTAWADDPYGPWHHAPAPDIVLGPPGDWDDDRLVRGAIHYHNGRWYSPYTGAGALSYQGGMASADPQSSADFLTFETNTSADGATWEGWLPVTNGGAIASTTHPYFQYRANFTRSAESYSPTLTSVTLGYEDTAIMAPLPPSSALIGCGSVATVDFQLTPGVPIRAYSAEVRATAELTFGVGDVTVYTVPAGAPDVFIDVRPGTDGGVIIDYSLLGPTSGITEPSIVFSIEFTGAADGDGVVSFFDVLIRDLDIQPLPVLFDQTETIGVDCTGPGPVGNLSAVRGHEEIVLSWDDPTDPDLAQVEVWRAMWHDGTGASAYPEYDDLLGDVIPARPANSAAADASPDWTLVHTAALGDQAHPDPIVERGVYLYELFPVDVLGNAGSPAAESVRATNYLLGDVVIPYDGLVSILDIIQGLALSYGEDYEDGANGDYNAECDVGPTYDMTPWGIPITDDQVEFEDLVIFGINFGASPPDPVPSSPAKQAPEPLHLAWSQTETGDWVLSLTESSQSLQALNLRAAIAAADQVEANLGADLQQTEAAWFIARDDDQGLDLAVVRLGAGDSLPAGTELLRIVAPGEQSLGEVTVLARDADNRELEIALSGEPVLPPASYRLYGNVPNPFNPRTEIRFDMPESQPVRLLVYDVSGRVIRRLVTRTLPAGRHEVAWNGDDDDGRRVPSGVYFYRIEAGPLRETGKMMMVK